MQRNRAAPCQRFAPTGTQVDELWFDSRLLSESKKHYLAVKGNI